MCQIEPECTFQCPFCMSNNILVLDVTEGAKQSFVVDCEVCCSPVRVNILLGLDADQMDLVAEAAT